MTVQDAVEHGSRRLALVSAHPRRDAELLTMYLVGIDLAALLAHPERTLTQAQAEEFDSLLARRLNSEPIQYILGKQEFFGLTLKVTPDVLIPRPETEFLVESLLGRVDRTGFIEIADVGTGSGAIAIALARELPRSMVTAIDISADALSVARQNAEQNGVLDRMRFLEADLLENFTIPTFDAVVSNPPYVASVEKLEAQVERYEPHVALFAGATGLKVYERLIPQAHRALRPGGWLLLEIGAGRKAAISNLLAGWNAIEFVNDLQGILRVAIARQDSR